MSIASSRISDKDRSVSSRSSACGEKFKMDMRLSESVAVKLPFGLPSTCSRLDDEVREELGVVQVIVSFTSGRSIEVMCVRFAPVKVVGG